ncbi:hypothetical protein HMPREF9440_02019 [Sutterella parvirubra YIT 11816]|uniref:Uncharacterized protein n=1 Tax=Sutterella parvirubra YIT 11816 TaxID=762967 RepID=H3KGY0_9BURK|nr:hypothetical protein HMPREF9440_02019 [Sutterella parvirubra YIT 11816]
MAPLLCRARGRWDDKNKKSDATERSLRARRQRRAEMNKVCSDSV